MILSDQVVIVTGVGPGLGAKLATRAVAEGAQVVMAARSTGTTEQLEKETGGAAVAVAQGDVLALHLQLEDSQGAVTGNGMAGPNVYASFRLTPP